MEQPPNYLTLSSQYAAAAERFIEDATAAGRPFFLYYCSHHVHSPQFAGKDTTNGTARGRFGDSLAEMDLEVGRIIGVLEREQQLARTLFFFTSDSECFAWQG